MSVCQFILLLSRSDFKIVILRQTRKRIRIHVDLYFHRVHVSLINLVDVMWSTCISSSLFHFYTSFG